MDILNIPDIYDFDNFYNYENINVDTIFLMDIEIEYNDYVKKIIFIANNKQIYSCKCLFYSGNIIDINLLDYIHVINNIIYIDITSLIGKYKHIKCFSQLIKYNNDDNYNIFKLYFDFIQFDIINKHIVDIAKGSLFVIPNNNINDISCEFIFIKSIQLSLYRNIYFENFEIEKYLINIIYNIEIQNIINKTGYIYIDSNNIIGSVDRVINKIRKRFYKIDDITFEYYYDNRYKHLYLLLKKCGNYTFNDHIKCKICNNLRKNININFDITVLENLILCKYHNNIYENKLKNSFNSIEILKNIILKQIN